MSEYGKVYDDTESVAAKLRVLRDSCTGVLSSEESNPDLIWFQGAEAMLKEAVDELQKALRAIEKGSI